MFGAAYDGRADVFSLGAVLAEMVTGRVLFPNHAVPTMLARHAAFFGQFTPDLLMAGRAE